MYIINLHFVHYRQKNISKKYLDYFATYSSFVRKLAYNLHLKDRKMQDLSIQTKVEIATKMVILDAIEKGHTDKKQLIEYMQSDVFEKSVQNYITLLNEI